MKRTLHYNLPLFEGEDIPSIIVDWNSTVALLDSKLYELSIGNAGEEIISEIEGIKERINSLEISITDLQYEVFDINAYLSEVTTALGELSDKIDNFQVPIATSSEVGGIKVGKNLTIEADGTLNASGGSVEPDISHGPIAGTFKFKQVRDAWFDSVGNYSLTLPIGFRIFANGNASISFNKMLYGMFDGSIWTLTGDQSSEILSTLQISYWDTTTQSSVTVPITDLVNNNDLLFFRMGNLGNYEQVYFNVKNSNDDEVSICEAPPQWGTYAGEFVNMLSITLVLDNGNNQLVVGRKELKKFSRTFHSDMVYSEAFGNIPADPEIEITDMGTYLTSQQILNFQDHFSDFIHFGNAYGNLPTWEETDESFIPFRDDIGSITNVTVDNDSSRVWGSDSDYYGKFNLTFDNLEIYKVKSEYIDRFTQPV